MIDHFIEWFLRIIGQVVRAIAKEKVIDQIAEVVADTTVDAVLEKRSPKASSAEVKSSENFQELLATMAHDGLGALAVVSLIFAILCDALCLIKDLIGNRFFFHDRNIIYAAELILLFFVALFVPCAIVGIAAPLFLKLASRRARGWLAFAVFIILFGIVTWLITILFPGLSEVLVKHAR